MLIDLVWGRVCFSTWWIGGCGWDVDVDVDLDVDVVVAVEVNAAQGANTAASGSSQALSIGLRRQCV